MATNEPMPVTTGMSPESDPYLPTSVVLERLICEAPTGNVTLAWVTDHLSTRSFGIILLLLGVCGLLPVASTAAGLIVAIPATQMILGHAAPIFPRRVARRPVATLKLATMLQRVIPALRYMERFIRPRWPTPFQTTKRVVGVFVLLLGAGLLIPIPLSNIPSAVVIVLVAFAYLEEDGILLAGALMLALVLFAAGAAALWGTIAGIIGIAD
jgi:hypothetical protein